VNKLLFAALLLVAPLAARADVGLRLGGEADIAYHDQAGSTHGITDNWPLGLDVMLSYWTPGSILSIDLELGEQWVTSDTPSGTRRGTVLRPGIRITPPMFPTVLPRRDPHQHRAAHGLTIARRSTAGGHRDQHSWSCSRSTSRRRGLPARWRLERA